MKSWIGLEAPRPIPWTPLRNPVTESTLAVISSAKTAGLPVASLNSALTAFQVKYALAVADCATADAALTAHDGFDDSGNVTDVTAAAATIKTASDALFAAHIRLANSSFLLKHLYSSN